MKEKLKQRVFETISTHGLHFHFLKLLTSQDGEGGKRREDNLMCLK